MLSDLIQRLGIARGPGSEQQPDVFEWGTVTSQSPLRVRIDTDIDELPITPVCFIPGGPPVAGTRVWTQRHGKRVLLLGAPTG